MDWSRITFTEHMTEAAAVVGQCEVVIDGATNTVLGTPIPTGKNPLGVGVNPITIVGIAFGLASDTFMNVRSRLLLEVDKSTVETVVINGQNRYRMGLTRVVIDTRVAAVYALRSYLRICTPFTIENQINTTVATIGIRGTEYTLAYGNSVSGSVGEGQIDVCNGGGCLPVGSGQSFYVAASDVKPEITSKKTDLPPWPLV
jgi:DNA-binding beta-propeller fold protein YncE